MQVAQVMNTDLATISPHSSLMEGMNLLGKTNTEVLYLVDEQQTLLGIVPDFSLLKAYMNGSNLDSPLEKLSSPHIPKISGNSDILEIAPQFRDGQHCRMAVVEEGKLIGQIERAQILAYFAENQANASVSPDNSDSQTHLRLDGSHNEHLSNRNSKNNSSLGSLLNR